MEKITKKLILDRLEWVYNVTGNRYSLSSQLSGNGRGYSVMDDQGRHVMTYGHVPIQTLDACLTAFCKGFQAKEAQQ